MLFSELKETLKYTSLYDLGVKDNDKAIAVYVNNGLKDIQSRFSLNPKFTNIILDSNLISLPDKLIRIIDCVYTDTKDPVRFYQDTKIADDHYFKLIHTGSNKILLNGTIPNWSIDLLYEERVPQIDLSLEDMGNEIIDIPDTFINALILYVGFISHASMDSNIKSENNTYYMRYTAECKRLEETYRLLESNSLDTEYKHPIIGIN